MLILRNVALVLVASVIALLVVWMGYGVYLVADAMVTADWTWTKAGALVLGSAICWIPIALGLTGWAR